MKARFLLTLVAAVSVFATSALSSAHGKLEVRQAGGQRGPGGPGGPGGGRERQMRMREELYKKLHLTAAQKKKIDAYDAHTMRAMQAAMKTTKDRSALRPMMQKMRDERGRFMKKTLTGSQYKIYQAEEAKRAAERKARGGGRGGGGPRPGAAAPRA